MCPGAYRACVCESIYMCECVFQSHLCSYLWVLLDDIRSSGTGGYRLL